MEWLDAHAGGVQAIAAAIQVVVTVVLVCITIYYAIQTRRQVTAAQDALAAQFRPMLVPQPPDLDTLQIPIQGASDNQADLVVKNVGAGPALNGVLQVVRHGIPGDTKAPLMLQFGQTRLDALAPDDLIGPRVLEGYPLHRFIDASSTSITDELTLEYQSLDGRWYQTIVTRRGGRWWDLHQVALNGPSSRAIDTAELAARGMTGI